MANDIITKLDDEQVYGLTLNQAVQKMRGPANGAGIAVLRER
jgi:carboxyl-terminal processing protease